MFLHAGIWGRTKVINVWFSHNKTCDVDLLTCNRTKQSTSLWFICCSDPCCSLKHPVRVLPAAKLQSIMFYDVFTISACWTWSHLMNFLFVSMCKTNSRQLLIITAGCLTLYSVTHNSLFVFKFLNAVKALNQKQFWCIRNARGKFFVNTEMHYLNANVTSGTC